MKADRFFPIAYDMRHNPKIELLRDSCGGLYGFGRWVALMGILYDSGGVYEYGTPLKRSFLRRELEMQSDDQLDAFLHALADCELIEAEMLEAGRIASNGICEQLEYKRRKTEAGKKGMAKRWDKGGNNKRDNTC